jgi:hypothetical protein
VHWRRGPRNQEAESEGNTCAFSVSSLSTIWNAALKPVDDLTRETNAGHSRAFRALRPLAPNCGGRLSHR